ncbi:putative alpha-L-rhamnosidase [Lunatimonas lonarensis]|uniref:Putative alpha-L-rhamnosidase n=1 Tax=Lunatimonas lonarensis TaxID=1232681 RepID=R7ZWC3_9BACT|nr:glycosyl hydrolase [Lunatimonas lonarensis]EON78445.1 putative alpha-L-rhamnosidase [Lunatimonas lonarensis]
MKKTATSDTFTHLLVGFLLILTVMPALGQVIAKKGTESDLWPAQTQTSKPWSRWWWMGNAVDRGNISYLMKAYAEAGLGGLEVAPIYGAKGFEEHFIEYLSPEWLDMLHHTISEATSHQMGIDLTQGTGWPFGGPWVSPEMAAQRMHLQEYTWENSRLDRPIGLEGRRMEGLAYEIEHVMAFPEEGGPVEITHTLQADGSLRWNEPNNHSLWVIFRVQTGQQVKRAAPGGQGFTLDHFSKTSVKAYLDHFGKAFAEKTPLIRAFYNDSFEVYGADFTAGFFDYFERKRGYDLKRHLPELLSKNPSDRSIRLKSDYRETISDMLLENFTQQWTEWAHDRGKKTKNQAHGSPGNLLDLYASVDIPEGETFGSSFFPIPGLRRDSADVRNVDPDPIMLKFASSAAHLSGNPLVSSETFTWLGEHFKSSFSQAKPELEQAFLAGINHMFYHGVTYSPKEVDFPGWLFYASLNLTTHNSLWAHFRGFNDFVTRSQSVLQYGTPSQEILMYWPIYDVWADPQGLSKMITVHNIDEWLHPTAFYKESKSLMEKGYSVDFVSDALLQTVSPLEGRLISNGGSMADVICVPKLAHMQPETLNRLVELASLGGRVIFQEKPSDVPGFYRYEERKADLEESWAMLNFRHDAPGVVVAKVGEGLILQSSDFQAALDLLGVQRELLSDTGLKFIKRIADQEAYYYLVNHSANNIDGWIPLNHRGAEAILLDPQHGHSGKAATRLVDDQWQVRVQIAPGESMIVKTVPDKIPDVKRWRYRDEQVASVPVSGPWMVSFVSGGPTLPDNQKIDSLLPWTEFGDERNRQFSGLGVYETSFNLGDISEQVYRLHLGSLFEGAKVWVNGVEVGYVYGLPFTIDISHYVKSGTNSLKIEVANLMANRIRYMDQQGQSWRNYHEINFVNIDYKPFDASNWQVMPSGLGGPVHLEIFR